MCGGVRDVVAVGGENLDAADKACQGVARVYDAIDGSHGLYANAVHADSRSHVRAAPPARRAAFVSVPAGPEMRRPRQPAA